MGDARAGLADAERAYSKVDDQFKCMLHYFLVQCDDEYDESLVACLSNSLFKARRAGFASKTVEGSGMEGLMSLPS